MARISFIEKENADPVLRDMFQKMEDSGGKILNLFKTIAHSPKIGRDFIRLGISILLKGDLSPKLRELAILRVGNLEKSKYEWSQHVQLGLLAGLNREQIDEIESWESSVLFNVKEKAVLQYTDELAKNVHVSNETFKAIKGILNEKCILELTVTIGYYEMVCRVLEGLNVELEGELVSGD